MGEAVEITCADAIELFHRRVAETITDDERAALVEHAETCRACHGRMLLELVRMGVEG